MAAHLTHSLPPFQSKLTDQHRYRDVVIRLEPIIMELERSEDIMIVTHQAILRCIYAYFMKKSQEESPWMAVPLHTLIKLTPRAYGTLEERYDAKIPAVSTWRGKGSVAKHEDPTETTVKLGSSETP
jgi:6-phosphofructo-2-kinase/fructose-2,6-biphosphatase 2